MAINIDHLKKTQYQQQLKAGENIKNINGQSLLGAGNIEITSQDGVAMSDNEDGGVDLSVNDTTRTLALQSDVATVKDSLTNITDILTSDVVLYDHKNEVGGNINPSRRWFVNQSIEANTLIKSLDINVGTTAYSTGTIYIELWELGADRDTLTLVESYDFNNNNNTGVINFPINYRTNKITYVSVYRVGTYIPQIKYIGASVNGVIYPEADIVSTTFTISSMSVYGGYLCLSINISQTKELNNVIFVGTNEKFNNIQSAINSIDDDSSDNRYIIFVNSGIYPRFSMRSSVTGINRMRYISIIGLDKYSTKIVDHSGHYVTGSCDIWTEGTIENLTIEVDHTNDTSEKNRKSYALHSDFGASNCEIRNCILISHNAPAVGIGMYQDMTIKLVNCDIINKCPVDYGTLANYGAIFCHSNSEANITNQNLIIDSCKIVSLYGSKGAWISKIGTNSEFTFESRNTMYYSHNSNPIKVDTNATISPYSFGNNAENVNT